MTDITINKSCGFTNSLHLAGKCIIAMSKIVICIIAGAVGFVVGFISSPYIIYTGIRGGLRKWREIRNECNAHFAKSAAESTHAREEEFDTTDDPTGIKGVANKLKLSTDPVVAEYGDILLERLRLQAENERLHRIIQEGITLRPENNQ